MNIEIFQLIEGARKATGLTVVIDVFRAFSLEPFLFSRGVDKIYPVGDIEKAYLLKEQNPRFLLAGERKEKMPEGFDFGNSLKQASQFDLQGKTVIHTTSAGTQGIVNATGADEIITGSFLNADAIIRYIQKVNPAKLSLCCMGYSALRPTEEDTLCAEYLRDRLNGLNPDFSTIVNKLRASSGKRFFISENQSFAPEEDFYHCMKLSEYNFVLKASMENEDIVISRFNI